MYFDIQMKKLIWHHNNRTGGTTIENLWRDDIDIFHCDKNAYRQGAQYNYQRINEADIVHLHSNGICPLYARYYVGNESAWNKLISERMRMSVIRDPISKFESEWGSYNERKNGKMLPHVPNFHLDALNSPDANNMNASGFYLGQNKDSQISINDWIQVYCDHHLHGLPGSEFDVSNMFSKSHVENTSSPFFSNTFTEAYGANAMRFFLTRNRQYLGLESNLSSEFILNPRIPFAQDILIANENLDGSLAALICTNKSIRNLSIFRNKNLSYGDVLHEIKGLRTHSRSQKFKDGDSFKLNSLNRQRFYMLNRKEFVLWQSATWLGSKFIKRVSS